MRALDPTCDQYWKLKLERTVLREAIDVLWLDSHRFGTRKERWAPLPWPDDTRARWRVVREFIEAYCGVPLGDVVEVSYAGPLLTRVAPTEDERAAIGDSVRQWIAILDELQDNDSWFRVFRDSVSLGSVRGVDRYFSLMVQGEGDYHWAIRHVDMFEPDPPVFAFDLNYELDRFVPDRSPPSYGSYGSYASLTDFARAMLDGHLRAPLGTPLHRLSAVKPETHPRTADVRTYGESLSGVWETPLVPRVPFTDEVPNEDVRDREEARDVALPPPSFDELRDAFATMYAGYPLPADDAPLASAGYDEDDLSDFMTELSLDYGIEFDPSFEPKSLGELITEACRLANAPET